jgi:outer membrane lipoprotein-sorting protein
MRKLSINKTAGKGPGRIRSSLKKRILVQDQGGREFQPGGASEANAHRGKYMLYFEDLEQAPNAEIGPKDFFESGYSRFAGILGITLALFFCLGWSDSWEGIRGAADDVASISAEFVQEKHLPILARPLVSRGVFYFSKPDSLRWEYRQPIRSILLMQGGTIRRYMQSGDGLKEDTGVGMQAMQFVMAEITHWFQGRFDESRVFAARLEEGKKIVLLPKEESFAKVIQRIELLLSNQPGVIDSVIIYESSDSFTRLNFENTRLNEVIPDDLFRRAG